MDHEIITEKNQSQGTSNREFGLVFCGFFLILLILEYFSKLPFSLGFPAILQCSYLQNPVFQDHPWMPVFAFISIAFLLFALLLPKVLSPLNWLWTKLGVLLHRIVSPIVLWVLFYLVFTPFSLVIRLFGNDLLKLRIDKNVASYWLERRPPGPEPKSLEDQF